MRTADGGNAATGAPGNGPPAHAGAGELLGFIRPSICLYAASLAAIGYLLYNKADYKLAYAMLSVFLGCAGAYAYNNINDVREDLINRKKTNYYAEKTTGKTIVALSTALGFYSATLLSVPSALIYLSFTTMSAAYSFFRIKRYLLLKNIWTALGVSQGLLLGAFASGIDMGATKGYSIVFLVIFAGSVISDMRDMEGDKRTGIRTIPVEIGISRSKYLVYTLSTGIIAYIISTGIKAFYVLLPFVLAMAILIRKGRLREAHATNGMSFMAMFSLLLSEVA